MSTRTILAPGVEIVEKDLSEYTSTAGASTALVMGFANQGQNYETVNMTSKTALVNYFGKPTNEAERYFFAACSEVLAQNGRLYAAKLPYDNESADKHVVAQYEVNNLTANINSLTQSLNIDSSAVYGDTSLSNNSAFANDLRDTFFGGFRATDTDISIVTDILSTSDASDIYTKIANTFNSRNLFISDTAITGTTGVALSSSTISNYVVRNDEDFLPNDISSEISVENGEVSSYFAINSIENSDILSVGYTDPKFQSITTVGDDVQFVTTHMWRARNPFGGIYKTTDDFETVERMHFANLFDSEYVIAIDGNTLLRTDGSRVEKSIDGGNIWTIIKDFGTDSFVRNIAAKNETNIFVLSGMADEEGLNGIIKTTDGGQHWESQKTIEDVYFTDIATLDGVIAVAIDTAGNVYKVSSGTSVWDIVSTEALGEDCTAIAIRDADTIYVIQDGTLLKSTNGGVSFTEVDSTFDFVDISVGTGSSDVIYAITKSQILSSSVGNESNFEVVRGFSKLELVSSMDVRGYNAIYQEDYDALPPEEQARYHRSSASTLAWASMTDLVKEVLSTASVSRFAEYFSGSVLSSSCLDGIKENLGGAYSLIRELDDSVSSYNEITFKNDLTAITTNELDYLVTGEQFLADNQFVIVDKLGGQYSKTSDGVETLGIIPIVTTAANALYFQNTIDSSSLIADKFAALSGIVNNKGEGTLTAEDTAVPFTGDPMTTDSVSERACSYFPQIGFIGENQLDREHLTDIGIVVVRAYVDSNSSNKVNFEVLESFVGSLDKNAKNPATNVTKYIETLVNNESEYIYLFANVKASAITGDMLAISGQSAKSLGFTTDELKKDISVKSINDSMTTIFQKNEDIHEKEIDYVVDAGVSNIAQYIACVYGTDENAKGPYDPCGENSKMFKLRSNNDKQTWLNILTKYNNFCANTRKDCMFLADGLRSLVLQGSKKMVRPTKPNNTIDSAILPNMKYLTGMNTTYGAGFCNWFMIADEFTGETFWCPPSVQAAGCYIFTDNTYSVWDAAAGLKRGVVTALDCSFSPSIKQAGTGIYSKSWNYAIDYADVGIILEGQKTLTTKQSALDRANVRRLFNRLKRYVYNIARQFVYEPNNTYTRQRFLDRLDPIFKNIQSRGGIYRYKLQCDEALNPPSVVDANEMRMRCFLAPTKTAEFILVELIATRTGSSFEEII